MDLKLTTRAQEAMSVAIRRAATDGHPQVEPAHLLDALLADPTLDPQAEAAKYLRAPDEKGEHGVPDAKAALDGARDILAERFSERADVLAALRERLGAEGWIAAEVIQGKEVEGEKFRDYFEHAEPIATLPSHRALALFRGRAQGVLALRFGLAPELEAGSPHPCILQLAGLVGLGAVHGADGAIGGRPADAWLADVLRWTWRVRLQPHMETEFFAAALTTDKDKIDKVVRTIAEARAWGVSVLPPDINASETDFTVVYRYPDGSGSARGPGKLRDKYGPQIRFGLGAVRGVGEAPFSPLAPAIVCAVHDATGTWFDRLPLTPEVVWRGLNGDEV